MSLGGGWRRNGRRPTPVYHIVSKRLLCLWSNQIAADFQHALDRGRIIARTVSPQGAIL